MTRENGYRSPGRGRQDFGRRAQDARSSAGSRRQYSESSRGGPRSRQYDNDYNDSGDVRTARSWDDEDFPRYNGPLNGTLHPGNGRHPAGGAGRQEGKKTGMRGRWRRMSLRSQVILVVLLGLVMFGASYETTDAALRAASLIPIARDGLQHLKAAQKLASSHKAITVFFDATSRDEIAVELTKAEADFSVLRAQLDSPAGSLWAAHAFPLTHGVYNSAAALVSAADEACLAGLDLVKIGPVASAWLAGGIFAESSTPAPGAKGGLTADQMSQITTYGNSALDHLQTALTYAGQADFSAIPTALISASQRAQIQQLMQNPDQLQTELNDARGFLQYLPTLLGEKDPFPILLMLQDRSELRSTGGFMGNYSQLAIVHGQLAPFSLHDTKVLDANYLASNGPLTVPQAYSSWYPFGGFGLRDANLSPDFPTSAKIAMGVYKTESGSSVSGMIAITPVLIESVLKVIGNVTVPEYGDVVTSTNLETLIHKHQLDLDIHTGSRKVFTADLAQAVMAKVRSLPKPAFLSLIADDLKYIQTKDIQMYFADPKGEAILHDTKMDSALTQGPGDGVSFVDSNIGVNKANQFVTVQYTDKITIDSHGTATHDLLIIYHFTAQDLTQLYGGNYYHTYFRAYVPPNAKLDHASGFNLSSTQPTQFQPSDVQGRQQASGGVYIDNGVASSVRLHWTVPSALITIGGQSVYQIVYQHQAGSHQSLTVTIQMPSSSKATTLYNGIFDTDKQFSIPA